MKDIARQAVDTPPGRPNPDPGAQHPGPGNAESGASAAQPEQRAEGITWRGPVVGLLASAGLAAIVPYVVLVAHNTNPELGYMPFGALVVLLLLARAWQPWIGHRARALRFTRPDLLLVYCMLLAVSGMAGTGALFLLIPVLATPFYYAGEMPDWVKLFHPHIPAWLAVRDPQAVLELFQSGQRGVPWRLWAVPLAVWGVQFLLFFWTSLCLVGMFRRRWIHAEHLVYPLAQIPLEVADVATGPAERAAATFRDRSLWVGCAVPLVVHSLNTLHAWFPNVPGVQLSGIPIGQSFVSRPWAVMADLRLHLSFATIGVAYLMPTELSFSFVVFFWLQFFQRMLLEAYGLGAAGGSAWSPWNIGMKEQLGGYAAFVAFLFWSARSDFRFWILDFGFWISRRSRRNAVLPTLSGSPPPDIPNPKSKIQNPKSDAWMLLGFLIGLAGLCAWSMLAGMSWWAALGFFAAVFTFMLAFARMVSASGLPTAQIDNYPQDMMLPFTGATGLGAANMTLIAFQERSLTYIHQQAVAPSLAQAFKIADAARIPTRVLVPALVGAFVVGVSVCVAVALPLIYHEGGVKLSPTWFFGHANRVPFDVAASRLTSALPPRLEDQWFVIAGAVIMGAMIAAHRAFLWWPLHPMGFLMAYGWQITALWFSFAVGGVIVAFINRFLGARTYWRLRPLFIGFILGEAITAALWLVLDALAGVQNHSLGLFI